MNQKNMNEKNEKKKGYRNVLTQKQYMKFIIANLISRFGDSIDAIAFTWLVYQITGSASWSAIIFAVNQLPGIFLQPFAGALVEGMNKKRIMVITDFIRGMVVVMLAVLFLTDNVNPWVLLGFTVIISGVEAFCMPASTAIVPKIIDMEYYEYGSSLSRTLGTVVELIGMGLAGTIIGLFGIGTAILIDAVTFFGSAVVLATLKVREEKPMKTKANGREYLSNLKGGLVYLKQMPVIRNFCILGVVANGIVVPINSLQSPMVSELMGQGPEFLSVFGIAFTICIGVSAVLFPKVHERISARTLVVGGGCFVGVGIYALTVTQYFRDQIFMIYAITIAACVLLGFGVGFMSSTLNVQFMKLVDQEYLARVGSIFNAGAMAASPVVSFAVSGLAAYFSVGQIFVVSSVLCVILFMFVGIRKIAFE